MSHYCYSITPIFTHPASRIDINKYIDRLCQDLYNQVTRGLDDDISHEYLHLFYDLKRDIYNQLEGVDTQFDIIFAADRRMQIVLDEIHRLANNIGLDEATKVIATAQVERVLRFVYVNRVITIDLDYAESFELENVFWSDGEYSQLENELNDLMTKMRQNMNLSSNHIKHIVFRSFEIEARIMQICAESVAKAILSEARVRTVEDIINAMEEKGWMLKGLKEGKPENNYMGGEQDNDWRKGVFAVLENNLGEEITIIVDPVSGNQNQLIVYTNPQKLFWNNMEFEDRMHWLKQTLEDPYYGYSVGDTTFGTDRIPEMESSELLDKAHATDIIRNKIKP